MRTETFKHSRLENPVELILSGLNVPNNAFQASVMRMHLDNEVAKAKGGSNTVGVDISNGFANDADIATLEQAASEKAKTTVKDAGNHEPEMSQGSTARGGVTIAQWASNEYGRSRLRQHAHEASGALVKDASTVEMVELLGQLIKDGKLNEG